MPDLNQLGSPYLAGILDAADEQMLLLETTRGCVFKCKFCYYPKSYDKQYYLSFDNVLAGLRHALERGAKEVFLLDPTLNQRKDFAELLRVLAKGNPDHHFTYFGELRGEGITTETARLLRDANFTEVEVGLQSIDPDAMTLMDRKNNLRAFERGVRAMMNEGIRVKVDLIIGLPGDSVTSVRRGLHYLHDGGLVSDLQVFNLAVLPGTAFRHEAKELGLIFQPRPPYYVLRTPTLQRENLFELMQEAQELFAIEWDALPRPILDFGGDPSRVGRVQLDHDESSLTPLDERGQAFTLWLRSEAFDRQVVPIQRLIRETLTANPYATLQVVLEPLGTAPLQQQVNGRFLEALTAVCQEIPTYLDKFYALQPGQMKGAKRIVNLLPLALRDRLDADWLAEIGEFATIVWRVGAERAAEEEMESHEYVWTGEVSA
jgi:MoaA/NifB/PqqE/SkfB family radical SAM enzyme